MSNSSKQAKRKKDKRKKRLDKYQQSQKIAAGFTPTQRKLGKAQLILILVLMIAASAFIFYKLSL